MASALPTTRGREKDRVRCHSRHSITSSAVAISDGGTEAERLGGREIDDKFESGRLLNRNIAVEGSCLTFTPNTTALHSVPMARRGRASFAKTRAPASKGTLPRRGAARHATELTSRLSFAVVSVVRPCLINAQIAAALTVRLRHGDVFLRLRLRCPKNCTPCHRRSGG
jgi:hypothetical protein